MSSVLQQMWNPVRRALVLFFRLDLAVVKQDAGDEGGGRGGLRIVLKERGSSAVSAKPRSRAELESAREKLELSLMREQLARLLTEQPQARQTLRHLVFVEHALDKKGLRALHKLPLDVLQRALEQLEGLVTNWSPTGLASLRSRMAVAIIDREHGGPDAEADAYRTAAVLDANLLAPIATAASAAVADDSGDDDDAALAAAYAAMGHAASRTSLEVTPELGSPSARGLATRSRGKAVDVDLDLRELQS